MSLFSEQIDALLSAITEHIAQGNANKASQSLEDLNKILKTWCNSTQPPNEAQLIELQTQINEVSSGAITRRENIQAQLLSQRQSSKAISKYKSTK